jgi:elongation factor Tu
MLIGRAHNDAMAGDQVRVKARIRFLSTEEGGRRSALEGGGSYRPNHNFFGPDDKEMCMGFIELADGERVAPGETVEKDLTLALFPPIEPEMIHEGRDWRIQEGAQFVAVGTILNVLDPTD